MLEHLIGSLSPCTFIDNISMAAITHWGRGGQVAELNALLASFS